MSPSRRATSGERIVGFDPTPARSGYPLDREALAGCALNSQAGRRIGAFREQGLDGVRLSGSCGAAGLCASILSS